jgi:hypothetical protein
VSRRILIVEDNATIAEGIRLNLALEGYSIEVAPTGERDIEWEKELKLEVSSGLSYRVAPGWFLGGEARYASVYPDWTNGLHRETYAVFAGPSIHYGGKKWWFTATYLPQLFGSPSPDGSRALDEYEKREFRIKLGYNF